MDIEINNNNLSLNFDTQKINIGTDNGVGKKYIVDGVEKGEIFNDYENNKAVSECSHAEGNNNLAGCKAFRVVGKDNETSSYYLNGVEGLEIGDVYSVRFKNYYIDYGTITSINTINNRVIVDNIVTEHLYNVTSDPTSKNDIFFVLSKPYIGTMDVGLAAHTEGRENKAICQYAHVEGRENIAGYSAHAEGRLNKAIGDVSHAEGLHNNALGAQSHVEGLYNTVEYTGENGHAEGERTTVKGKDAHAEGYYSVAKGFYSHAEGNSTQANGDSSHTEGTKTIAVGNNAHAEGTNSQANKHSSHAEGNGTQANGEIAHAEGSSTIASGWISHAEGNNTQATGPMSHSEGYMTRANAHSSHAEGNNTIADGEAQHVQGKYNIVEKNMLHIVGNGTGEDVLDEKGNIVIRRRSNAYTLDWNGNGVYAGNLKINGDKDVAVTTDNNNFKTSQTINGTLTINGDIVQNGESYETHAEQLFTEKDEIITRDGAVGGLSNGELTGIRAKKYDGENDGQLGFDADGTARVGDVGDTQPLLTRDEVENLKTGQVLIWDGINLKAIGSNDFQNKTELKEKQILITYEDGTTETVKLVVYK